MEYFTTTEKEKYYKIKSGDFAEISDVIMSIKSEYKDYKKKIYELMEEIYIRNFDKFFTNKEADNHIRFDICDDNLFLSAKFIINEMENEILKSETIEYKNIKDKIIEFYNFPQNLSSVIGLNEAEKKIEIKDFKKLRPVFNKLLNILPFDIYKKDL